MTILKRIESLENAMEKHLIESGEIRSDLAWIKRGMYGACGIGATILVTIVGALAAHVIQ